MNRIEKLNKVPFFYILSMGRSGSTLLQLLLDAHPETNIPFESRFIIHLHYKYSTKTSWTVAEKKMFLNDLYKDYKINTYWEIDKKKLEQEILSSSSKITFFELCRLVTANFISFFPKEAIKVQGSKNPIYGLWSDVLYQINKESKFIHLIRNPYGVVASHKKLGKKNLTYYAYRWDFMNKKIEKLKRKTPHNFITISYEDLINKPEETVKKVCVFLGIDFLASQMKFNEKIKEQKLIIEASNEQTRLKKFNSHMKNLTSPINSSIGDSWQQTLTKKEIEDISFITKKTANKYSINLISNGKFNLKFIPALIKINFRYFRQRIYYKYSFSIR
jgi:hypothetical protein